METFALIPIKNFRDALIVRKIRNECRLFMTKSTAYISTKEQHEWYFKTYKPKNKIGEMRCFLFKVDGQDLGFGFIRKINGIYWITLGLNAQQRGKGFGRILLKALLEEIHSKSVMLDVLKTNIAALKLYQGLGFKKVKEEEINDKSVIVMKLSKEIK